GPGVCTVGSRRCRGRSHGGLDRARFGAVASEWPSSILVEPQRLFVASRKTKFAGVAALSIVAVGTAMGARAATSHAPTESSRGRAVVNNEDASATFDKTLNSVDAKFFGDVNGSPGAPGARVMEKIGPDSALVAIIWDSAGVRRVVFQDIRSLDGATEYFQKVTPQGATFTLKLPTESLVTTFKVDRAGEHATIIETK